MFVFFKPRNKSIWLRRQFPGTLRLGSIMKRFNPYTSSVKLRFFGRKLFVWRRFPGAVQAALPWWGGGFAPSQVCVAVIDPQSSACRGRTSFLPHPGNQDRAGCPAHVPMHGVGLWHPPRAQQHPGGLLSPEPGREGRERVLRAGGYGCWGPKAASHGVIWKTPVVPGSAWAGWDICVLLCNCSTPLVPDLGAVCALPWVFSRAAPEHLCRKP